MRAAAHELSSACGLCRVPTFDNDEACAIIQSFVFHLYGVKHASDFCRTRFLFAFTFNHEVGVIMRLKIFIYSCKI